MAKVSEFEHHCVVCGGAIHPSAGTAGEHQGRGDYVVLPQVVRQGRSYASVYRHKTCAPTNDAPTPLVKGTRNGGACDTCGQEECDGVHPAAEEAFVQPALPDLPDEARPDPVVTLPGGLDADGRTVRMLGGSVQLSLFGGGNE